MKQAGAGRVLALPPHEGLDQTPYIRAIPRK